MLLVLHSALQQQGNLLLIFNGTRCQVSYVSRRPTPLSHAGVPESLQYFFFRESLARQLPVQPSRHAPTATLKIKANGKAVGLNTREHVCVTHKPGSDKRQREGGGGFTHLTGPRWCRPRKSCCQTTYVRLSSCSASACQSCRSRSSTLNRGFRRPQDSSPDSSCLPFSSP
jgi:hypothetical protein